MIEAAHPQHIDGEVVYTITTLGTPTDQVETMRRDARRAKVQEYIKRHEEALPDVGLIVDTEL